MRIAQIAPLYEAVPPKFYGGTERIVAALTEALVGLGHDVTLFASADSVTRAELVPCRDQALRLDPDLKSDLAAHVMMLESVRARADEFDILHFHIDLLHCALFEDIAERTVTTLHGRQDLRDYRACYERFAAMPMVSISDHQRRAVPDANWVKTVYHGLPTDQLRPVPFAQGGYLAFLGRMSPEKGPLAAIEIARRTGLPLKMAAKVDAADRDFFDRDVVPLLDHPLIEFVGEIGEAEKAEFLGRARALLFPIAWPEPFGLVMIEAMACGTPVIAFNQGSVPEVVEPGLTGVIVDDVEGAVAAVGEARRLNRRRIRERFETRFAATAMARSYLSLYTRLLNRPRPVPAVRIHGQPSVALI